MRLSSAAALRAVAALPATGLCRFATARRGSAFWLDQRHGSLVHQQLTEDRSAAVFLAARFSQSRPPCQGRASRVADAIGIRRPWTRRPLIRDWQL
jgi:hypothetical protein